MNGVRARQGRPDLTSLRQLPDAMDLISRMLKRFAVATEICYLFDTHWTSFIYFILRKISYRGRFHIFCDKKRVAAVKSFRFSKNIQCL